MAELERLPPPAPEILELAAAIGRDLARREHSEAEREKRGSAPADRAGKVG
jgi:hypothetical protein